jgi:uncharacterized RDD family membrane protein YckC
MQDDSAEYAGFWIRTVASVIDTVLVTVLTVPLLLAIYGWDYFDPGRSGVFAGTADFLLSWVLPSVAVIVFWIYRSATPGKMMLSLRIVDARSGAAPGPGQSIGRYFGYFVSIIPMFMGLIWVAFDPRKQGWHDKLAGTVVLRSRGPRQQGSH